MNELKNTKIQTVSSLQKELSDLKNVGLGKREIYQIIKSNGIEKLIPFDKKLTMPTALDEALTGEELDDKKHIVFI